MRRELGEISLLRRTLCFLLSFRHGYCGRALAPEFNLVRNKADKRVVETDLGLIGHLGNGSINCVAVGSQESVEGGNVLGSGETAAAAFHSNGINAPFLSTATVKRPLKGREWRGLHSMYQAGQRTCWLSVYSNYLLVALVLRIVKWLK